MCVWSVLSGQLMQQCAAFPTLNAACRDVLDSYFRAHMPMMDHLQYLIRLTMSGVVDSYNQKSAQFSDCPPPYCPDDTCAGQHHVCRDHHVYDSAAHWSCPEDCPNEPEPELCTCALHNPAAFERRVIDVIGRKNLHQHSQTCRKGPRGCMICRMCYPQVPYAQTTFSQLHLPELPPVPVDGSAMDVEAAAANAPEPLEPSIPPDMFRLQPGDRPSAINGPERPRHPFGKRDDRVIVTNMKRPEFSREEVLALLESCKQAHRERPGPPPWEGYDPAVCNSHPAADGVRIPPWPSEENEVRALLGRRLIELEEQHKPVYDRIVSVLQTMNGAVADTTPIASALLACNCCSYAVGCQETAKQILFYLVPHV